MSYCPTEAARIAGISPSSVKNYVTRHGDYFSPGARPAPGQPRSFSPEDVRVLAYIAALTRQAVTHADIAARLAAGELADFTWSAPPLVEARPQGPPAPQDQPPAALVLAQVLSTQLDAARAREAALTDRFLQREQDLHDRLLAAEARAARAEGELAAIKEQRRPWWKRLFGG